jgi:D-xylulose kinase
MHPEPSWVEQKAEDWWNAICGSTKHVMKNLPKKEELVGITVTNQRETIVPVDTNGNPLRNALVWQDRRSTEECRWLLKNVGAEKIYDITGLTIDPYFSAPKILWLKEHESDLLNKTDKFLLVHDYIINKLTGRNITEHSNASRTMLFDLKQRRWSEELLSALEISEEILPEVQEPGSFVGELTTGAANETGLPSETHVYTGGGDQQCAALGLGVTVPGHVKATTGTGTFCLAYADEPVLDPDKRLLCSAHVVAGAYVVEASIFTTGASYRWIRDNFAKDLLKGDQDPYGQLDKEAEKSEVGSKGVTFIPHLAGAGAPHWNPDAVGIIHGLSLGHSRGDIVRAMMEGVAVELRKNIDVMRSLNIPINDLRLAGGGARSELWCQIQADICGLPVRRSQTEDATALGAAILGAVGAKIFDSLDTAVQEMVQDTTVLKPDPELKEIYQSVYDKSLRLYENL